MYGLAMPQLYAEFYLPFLSGVSFKAGHFYTPIGYESVMAPKNFFYSHSYTMQYGEPFTHTGVLGTVQINDQLQVLAGVARGWDAWEDPNDDGELLAGIGWNSANEDTSINLTLTSGDQDNGFSNAANRTLISFVLSRAISGFRTTEPSTTSSKSFLPNGTPLINTCSTTSPINLLWVPASNTSGTRTFHGYCRYLSSWPPAETITG
jgi:hypothetical protein